MSVSIKTVPTKPYDGQKPGTSGLRKRVKIFQQENYTENFIQATLEAIPEPGGAKGATLVIGGDGRFYIPEALQIITKLSAGAGEFYASPEHRGQLYTVFDVMSVYKLLAYAKGLSLRICQHDIFALEAMACRVSKLIVGQNGILSTPAASNLIRKYKATGGILLTASHNPGGPDNDFGIKYNVANGGPAPESVTNKIYEITKTIKELHIADIPEVDFTKIGSTTIGGLTVDVINSTDDYVELMKDIFDFDLLRNFFKSNANYRMLFDGMNGVTGPYGYHIFVKELGLPESSVMNFKPLPDFGGGHPDPNLTYAHDLVERVEKEGIDFGAASDGDGDRNMIIGKGAFVTPSDSVAIIAHYAKAAIPYFQKNGVHGLARSMPTSQAVDLVAKKQGLEYFEVPTGWKFFGNLMDAGRCSVCGEESFGTGSDHIREKDGLWAILAWLSIIAYVNKEKLGSSVHDVLQLHYKVYGRNFFSRYDYEEVESKGAEEMVDRLRSQIQSGELKGKKFGDFTVALIDDFEYKDPIDNSVSKNQGIRIVFEDGSRIVIRLSGTGSQGATVRLYVEKYSNNTAEYDADTQKALKPLIDQALIISQLKEYTGRDKPTVIT
ncbi:hypothetical protein INT43_002209 [Umbelopsis isabellina]|uniref:phosphoglucomutase (alpha-D-glucose-1,6-bisphosphate-dependent) n=1 Tax=Mortierella isabellina TaxID=91625 RepID=A0A8H7Q442_MORIS|nr:hypothetical protein INT43_002209 [Umbelopsis isabellina]